MTLKKLFFAAPAILLISCGGHTEPGAEGDTTTTGTPVLVDSSTVTSENAGDVKFFEDSPESVTRYFYASRIREDEQWQSVCHPPAEQSAKLAEDLALHDRKIILQYTHLSTDCEANICNVHMKLKWADKNDKDNLEQAAEEFEYIAFLEKIDGLWWIIGFSAAVPV